MTNSKFVVALRRQAFGAMVLICVQAGLGMFVNLFVAIPSHHSGSQPSDFFTGSFDSVWWAISHGAIALVIHAVLGLLLAVMVVNLVVQAASLGRRAVTTWSVLGALFTFGAGFNGASFLDYHKDLSSFLMTTLALASLLCFAVVVYLPWERNGAETTSSS
jgi:hypothetical protein